MTQKSTLEVKQELNFTNNIDFCISSFKQNYLGSLFDKYGSNKGYGCYNNKERSKHAMCYNDIYDLLFCYSRNKIKCVLECGIGSKNPNITGSIPHLVNNNPGGSLRAWSDFFPQAKIIGIDIDPDVIFNENRISSYICNQTSKDSIVKFIAESNLQKNSVDIIIDDGLHEFNANKTLFEHTKDLLVNNGIYIIEDVWCISKQLPEYIDYFNNLPGYQSRFIKIAKDYLIVITKA